MEDCIFSLSGLGEVVLIFVFSIEKIHSSNIRKGVVMELGRRDFLKGVSLAALAVNGGIQAAENSMKAEEINALQQELDAIPGDEFRKFRGMGPSFAAEERDALYTKWPVLRRFDDAFLKVMREIEEVEVTDRPAVWYVYNMGVIVKTRQSLFSIDLSHRLSTMLADRFDFMIITHNHYDHYTEKLYQAMDSRHKTVIQNFRDNYGACLHVKDGLGGFSRGECRYTIKDVVIRTYETNHNHLLKGFVMPVEVQVGDYTILHVGDTFNTGDLRPERTPDLFIHHAWCWGSSNQTMDGINAFHPKCVVIAHHCELGHNKTTGGGGVPLARAYAKKAEAEAAGTHAIAPFWGDRIA